MNSAYLSKWLAEQVENQVKCAQNFYPANICPIIGSTTPERIIAAKKALELDYSREDWYRLLEARNGQSVP